MRRHFCRTGVTEYWRSGIPLVDFDIGRPDHLAPLLGFGGDESSKIGGRARKRRRTQIGEPRFYVGVAQNKLFFPFLLVRDFGGGGSLWRNPQPNSYPLTPEGIPVAR